MSGKQCGHPMCEACRFARVNPALPSCEWPRPVPRDEHTLSLFTPRGSKWSDADGWHWPRCPTRVDGSPCGNLITDGAFRCAACLDDFRKAFRALPWGALFQGEFR